MTKAAPFGILTLYLLYKKLCFFSRSGSVGFSKSIKYNSPSVPYTATFFACSIGTKEYRKMNFNFGNQYIKKRISVPVSTVVIHNIIVLQTLGVTGIMHSILL